MTTANDPALSRIEMWTDEHDMRTLAFELLPAAEQKIIDAEQASERRRLDRIVRQARGVDRQCAILSKLLAGGWRMFESAGRIADESGRWLYAVVHATPVGPSVAGGGGTVRVPIVIEDEAAVEVVFEADVDEMLEWQAKGELSLTLKFERRSNDLADYRGWRHATLLVKLADPALEQRWCSHGQAPTASERTESHCVLTYRLPFPRGQRGERGTAVDPRLFHEIRLLPDPWSTG